MSKFNKKLLVAVFNNIDNDGRVQRACDALSDIFDIKLLCLASSKSEFSTSKYKIEKICKNTKNTYLTYFLYWFKLIRDSKNFDQIYIHDFHLTLPAYLINVVFRKKIYYDAHELIIKRNNFWSFLEKLSINKFEFTIAANKERARLMSKYYNIPFRKIGVVRNISEYSSEYSSEYRYEAINKKLSDKILSYEKKIKVVYQGYITKKRGIIEIIDSIKYLSDDFVLFIAGYGPDVKEINMISQESNGKILYLGNLNREELKLLLKKVDIGIITYSYEGLNNKYCAPNKVYEYAQCGVIPLSTSQPTLRSIIKKTKIGETINKNSTSSDIAKKINYIIVEKENYLKNINIFNEKNNWGNEKKNLLSYFK